jgi:hypothetical protein
MLAFGKGWGWEKGNNRMKCSVLRRISRGFHRLAQFHIAPMGETVAR